MIGCPKAAVLLAVLLVIGACPVLSQESQRGAAEAPPPAEQIFADRAQEVGQQLQSLTSLAQRLREKASDEAAAGGGASAGSGGTFTQTFNKPKTSSGQQPSKPDATAGDRSLAAASSMVQLQAAAARYAEARKLSEESRKQEKANPAYASHLRKSAAAALESAEGWKSRAEDILGAAGVATGRPQQAATAQPRAIPPVEARCGFACRQLTSIAGKGKGDVRLELFDANRAPAIDVGPPRVDRTLGRPPPGAAEPAIVGQAPPGDHLRQSAPPPPPRTELRGTPDRPVIEFPNGIELDLGPLRDAIAATAPGLSKAPLFTPCDASGQPCPTLEFLRVLAQTDFRAQLQRVGGVALDVTFDALSLSGMSAFRSGTRVEIVEKPILISLRHLLSSVSAHLNGDAWSRLPEELRYPGSIERLHGYVLTPQGDDIVLVGRRAAHPRHRLDIDTITIAIRQVWRDSKIMGVSLDPLPNDISGPQYSRVINTPEDSVVARIMLDADYAMKRIVNHGRLSNGVTVLDIPKIIGGLPIEASISRFWLSPQRLHPGAVYVSSTARSALVETGVQLQTEELFLGGGQLLGSGKSGSAAERISGAFNADYRRFEGMAEIEPRGVFVQLHGLVDAVVLATLWRSAGLDLPILSELAALPYRRLRGKEAVPSSYPAIVSQFRTVTGTPVQSVGGVQLNHKQSAETRRANIDRMTGELEAIASAWPNGALSIALPAPVVLPVAEGGAADELPFLAAERALQDERFEDASRMFGSLLGDRPTSADLHAGLARAELGLARHEAAALAAWRAFMLAPEDDEIRLLMLDVAWQAAARETLEGFSPAERRDLSRRYVEQARVGVIRGRAGQVDRRLQWAVDLWEDNGEAHLLRHYRHLAAGAVAPAGRDAARAVRAYRRQAEDGVEAATRSLALALSVLASGRLDRVRRLATIAAGTTAGAGIDVTPWIADLEKAASEAHEGASIDPGLPLAPAVALLASSLAASIAGERDSRARLALFRRQMDDVVRRFPGDSAVATLSAQLRHVAADLPGALAEYDRAVAMTAPRRESLLGRAMVNAELKRCAAARADLERASAILPADGNRPPPEIVNVVRSCR